MKYELSRKELADIESQLGMIGHYERVIEALRVQWREILYKVYDRVEIPLEDRELVQVDLAGGFLVVEKPEEEKEEVEKK
jgi:hypothetical protein